MPFEVTLLGSAAGRGAEEKDFHACFESRLIGAGRSREWFALSDDDVRALLTWDLDECRALAKDECHKPWKAADLWKLAPETAAASVGAERLRDVARHLARLQRDAMQQRWHRQHYVSRKTLAYELKHQLGYQRVNDAEDVLDAIDAMMSALAGERVSLLPVEAGCDGELSAMLVHIADMAAAIQGRTSCLRPEHWSERPRWRHATQLTQLDRVLDLAGELERAALSSLESMADAAE